MSTTLGTLALVFVQSVADQTLSDGELHLAAGNRLFQTRSIREAEVEFRQAAQILEHLNGPNREFVHALNNLAACLAARHEFERALPVFRRAIHAAATRFGPGERAVVAANTAQVLIRLDDLGAASLLLDEAVPACERVHCRELPYIRTIRAEVYIARGQWDQAHADLDRVFQSGKDSEHLAPNAHYLRAIVWQRSGRHQQALREFAMSRDLAEHSEAWRTSLEFGEMLDAYRVSLKKAGHKRLAEQIRRDRARLRRR